jgi:hypothetical protein
VVGSLSRLENNSIARFTTLEMSNAHKVRTEQEPKKSQKQRVRELFSKYTQLTIAEINKHLNFEVNHPVCIIRDLRKAGVDIRDDWRKSASGTRYKVYWVNK